MIPLSRLLGDAYPATLYPGSDTFTFRRFRVHSTGAAGVVTKNTHAHTHMHKISSLVSTNIQQYRNIYIRILSLRKGDCPPARQQPKRALLSHRRERPSAPAALL